MLKTNDQDEITKASAPDLRKVKDEDFGSQRVYKKTSPNSVLTLYLGTRDVICRRGKVEPLRGVIYVDPKFVASHKIYGQLTLTFRYGREDEEVMGLKFCNEAIIALKQIWPISNEKEALSPLQQALIDRLGKTAYPFMLEVASLAPPSVQLVPAKQYTGAPIGTSYDVRVYLAADQSEDRLSRRSMVRLGVRVIHKITSEARAQPIIEPNPPTLSKSLRLRLSPKALKLANKFSTSVDENQHRALNGQRGGSGGIGSMTRIDIDKHSNSSEIRQTTTHLSSKGPEGCVDKPFLWTEGRVSLRAALDKSAYVHGEQITITIDVRNDSRKIIRKIRVFAVQHVDVCMFSNGKFKNVVADINESHQIKPNETHRKEYLLVPVKGPTKNWIAVEGSTSQSSANQGSGARPSLSQANATSKSVDEPAPQDNYKIASSAPRGPQTYEERNVFAIYVSYYVKVKLTLSGMGGEVSLKLPFILGHVDDEGDSESDKNDDGKASDRTNAEKGTPTKIIEEECGHDNDGGGDEAYTKTARTNADENAIDDADNAAGDSSSQFDTKQLERQLKLSHINVNNNNNTIESTDFDDDDDGANESCQNVITAQIHHHTSALASPQPHSTTEQITDC